MRYVWDKKRNDWVPFDEFYGPVKKTGLTIIGELKDEFRSPVDGKMITSRRELRAHNKTHGVVDRRELQGHKFETPKLPSAGPEVARAYKERFGKL